jgi:hypothetical protein
MISPALFIGLGTTGVNILEHLQDLVLEEYGVPALPIFKYLAIETDESRKVNVPSWAQNEIEVVHPVIKNTREIADELKKGQKGHLASWLNQDVLRIPGSKFTAGAAHLRMAGKLCLWENWNTCSAALRQAHDKITAHPSIQDTMAFLEQHYTRIGQAIDKSKELVGKTPRVHIVGTLCGGTCGGMLIDIAYLVRHMAGLWGRTAQDKAMPKLRGVLTIQDASILQTAQALERKRQAGNCWASLTELDYYNHPDSDYEATFPDGTAVHTNEPPLDYVYLLSCSTSATGVNLYDKDGNPDIPALNHMAAMVLFTETVDELIGQKERIQINFLSAKPIVPNTQEHMPCLASCGIATVWYPKYRIAEAAACSEGKRLCEQWLGRLDPNERSSSKKDAEQELHRAVRENLPIVWQRPGGSLDSDIRDWFEQNEQPLMSVSPAVMKQELQKQLTLLKEGEEYDRHMSDQGRQAELKKKILEYLAGAIETKINETQSLAYVECFLEGLDTELGRIIESVPARYPQFDRSSMLGDTTADWWARLVAMGKAVSQQRARERLDVAEDYFLDILKRVRNFRTRSTLTELRKDLGVSYRPSAQDSRRTLRDQLDELVGCLRDCIETLDTRAQEIGGAIGVTQDVHVITTASDVEEDIKVLSAKLANLDHADRRAMLDDIVARGEGQHRRLVPLSQFLRGSKDEIVSDITNTIRRKALGYVASVNIAEEILQRIRPEQLRGFARKALPHLELAGTLTSVDHPDFIVGSDVPDKRNLVKLQRELGKTTSSNPIHFGVVEQTPLLDHLLILYKEQGLLYMDENLATSLLFEERYGERAEYGLHTHRDGRAYFDVEIAKRKREGRKQMAIARDILSKQDLKGHWVESEIFQVESGVLVLRFKSKDGTNVVLRGDETGIERLTQDEHSFEVFTRRVKGKIDEIGLEGFVERLNLYLEGVERAEGLDSRQEQADYYEKIKKSYFSQAEEG